MARPTLYRPEYCEQLVEHMAKGLSFESFAGVLRINRDTLYRWAEMNEEFSDAHEVGRMASAYRWEQIGLDGVLGEIRFFNAYAWVFNMKNRFKWKDRQEIEQTTDHKISVEVAPIGMDELKRIMAKDPMARVEDLRGNDGNGSARIVEQDVGDGEGAGTI